MNLTVIALGLALGAGVLLTFRGAKRLADKSLPSKQRRAGFWWLNGGLLLAAASMVAVSFLAD